MSSKSASTPRGYIWNTGKRRRAGRRRACFNPTRVHLELHCAYVIENLAILLQPHEGTSGTRSTTTSRRACSTLQPHEGTSGTLTLAALPRDSVPASTPRGYIWNASLPKIVRRRSSASTPRGYIWNGLRPGGHRPRGRFNPTRVHLEPSSMPKSSRTRMKLQPHEGTSGTMPDFPAIRPLVAQSIQVFPSTLNSPQTPRGSTENPDE